VADTRRRICVYRLVAWVGVVVLLAAVVVPGGQWQALVDAPVFAFTLGVTFFLLLATFGGEFLRFIPDALRTLVCVSPEPNPRFADIARFGSRYVVGVGSIGVLIGLMRTLCSLADVSQIGPHMATAILSALYAVVVSEFFFVFLHKAYSGDGRTETAEPLSLRNLALPLAIVGLVLVLCLALLLVL